MADQQMRASTELNAIVPEIWSANFFDVLLTELVFNGIINRDYEGDIRNLGDTVHINTVPEFSDATELPEGGRNDADAVTLTQQDLVINRRIVKDFIVTKKGQLQSLPHMDKLQELAIFSINKRIQAIIIELSVPSAAAPDHQIAYDSGDTLALADLLEAKELLDTANVPGEDRDMVVSAAQLNDLFNITGFTSSDFITTGSPLVSGEVTSPLLGFRPHFTNEVAGVTHLFHRSYFTMAAQEGIGVTQHDLGVDGQRATRVNVDWLGGFRQLGDDRIVTIS